MTAAEWTEFAEPLPRPPPCEYENFSVHQSLSERPDLFRIVSPVKVAVLEELLKTHPNKAFVASVMDGLWYGFWPWATTNKEGYLTTHNCQGTYLWSTLGMLSLTTFTYSMIILYRISHLLEE